MAIFGIDVSGWQGLIDWPTVKGAGISFAVAKATEGNSYTDSKWARNGTNMAKSGIPVIGAYHYLRHGTGASEARYFLDVVRAVWPDLDDKLLAVDVEKDSTKTDITAFVNEFRRLLPTHPLILYTGGWWWKPRFGNTYGSGIGPLWHSRYIDPTGTAPADAYRNVPSSWWTPGYGGWSTVSILQFSSGCAVRGIGGRVDANAYRGTVGDLRRLAWDSKATIPPDTSTEGEPVQTITILPFGGKYTIPAGVDTSGIKVDAAGAITERRGWTVKDSDSSAAFDAYVSLSTVRGNPFLRVTNGVFAGYLVSSAGLVHEANPAPTTDDGITQATVDAAVAKARAEEQAKAKAAADAAAKAHAAELAALEAKQDALIEQAVTDTIAAATVEHTIKWNR